MIHQAPQPVPQQLPPAPVAPQPVIVPQVSAYQPKPQLAPLPQQPVVASISAPTVTVTPSLQPAAVQQMPKSVYDSLAPLDLPSKPVIYVEEQPQSQPQISKSVAASDDSASTNRDEKAKLESILLGSMMSKGTAAGMMMIDSSSGGGSTQSNMHHMTNRFLGMGKWSRGGGVSGQYSQSAAANMMMLANRPLPANYVCTICKKPGHHKQLCPEAVCHIYIIQLF